MNNEKTFDAWFHQIEHYALLSERFYDDVTHFHGARDARALAICMTNWLEAAFEAGVESTKQDHE